MYPTADEDDALPALRFVYDHDGNRLDLVVDGMSVAHWKVPLHPTRRMCDIVPAMAVGNALKAAPWWFARAVLAQFTDDLSVRVVNTVRAEVLGE